MMLHFLNDVVNGIELTRKLIITSYSLVLIVKQLVKRNTNGSHILISSLPGSALRTHVESLGKPRNVNKRS